ncbi:MAG: aryl-sulfate sulfotransferase [Candidatus Thorarchaeota archaeon]
MRFKKTLAALFCFVLVLLTGLAYDIPYSIVQTSEMDQEQSIDLDGLPIEAPMLSTVLDAPIQLIHNDGAFEGYNLFLLGEWNRTSSIQAYYLVVTDMNGDSLVEKYVGNNFYGQCVEFINSTTMLTGTEFGAALWNYYDDTMVYLNISGHHEYEYNPINNTFFTLNFYQIDIGGDLYQFDYIEEYDMNGTLVWSMDTHDFISHTQWCPYEDMWGAARDITHSNTVYFDADEDVIYYNSRNTNTFYKINHANSTVEWGVGEYGNFTLYNINGVQRDELFYHGHAVEPLGNDTFILFDNDYHNQDNPSNYDSRILEITIDLDTMTANESWAWEAPGDYWSIRWGDADRLPNGNRLGTFGTEFHIGGDFSARLVEVNDAGSIVWEMSFEKPDDIEYIVYRMERVLFSPLLEFTGEPRFTPLDDVELSWSTWYNYRPKQDIIGNYTLYLDESVVDSGVLEYDRYWRTRSLDINLGQLPGGSYTYTLSVGDDGGHYTNDTIEVSVDDFFTGRFGSTDIERGTPNSNITWTGNTVSPLICNITLNGLLDRSILWSGEDIVLNLTSLSAGTYSTELKLYNGPILVYADIFTIHVYPQEAPEFVVVPAITSIAWKNETTLEWDLFDWSYYDIRIYLDSGLNYSTSWDGGSYNLDWDFPQMDRGTYNVTVELIDMFGLQSNHTLFIEIISISPPVFVSQPDDGQLVWGSSYAKLSWIVYGGFGWNLYKDGVELQQGLVDDIYIDFQIENWREEDWRIDTYNLTLVVWDSLSSASATSWIEIIYDPSDPYADSFLEEMSEFYLNGDNVVGAPDDRYTTLYMDYANGYLTADMGIGEEIIDELGDDFIVYTGAGEYFVFISNSLETIFTQITGTFIGNASIDMSSTGIETARYVRIQFYPDVDVTVDAIEALHYNAETADTGLPEIIGPSDIILPQNVTSIELNWNVSDQTPWSFAILVDNAIMDSGIWTGGNISYTFVRNSTRTYNITLIVEDVFGNAASDSVMVSVEQNDVLQYGGIVVAVVAIAIPAVLIVLYFVKKRRG